MYTTVRYHLKDQRPSSWQGYTKVKVTRLNPSQEGLPSRGRIIKGRYIYAFEKVQIPRQDSAEWPLVWINGTAWHCETLRKYFANLRARLDKGLSLYG